MKLTIGSYVTISYEIKYLEHGEEYILATTRRKIARNESSEEIVDEPVIVRLGDAELPEFFEKLLQESDIDIGKEYLEEIPPEKAYGKRDTNKIESVPLKKIRRLLQQEALITDDNTKALNVGKILYANLGGLRVYYGRVLHVGDRDVVVDRNHPLAGKTMKTWFKIHDAILPTAPKEQLVRVILRKLFGAVESFLRPRFLSENILEIELSKDYFLKFSEFNRQTAETIIRELYTPKIVLMARANSLFKDLGITRIIWIDEYEVRIETPAVGLEKSTEGSIENETKEQ
ncbi:MAG: hypothetical protein NDP13_00990 [Crenarchaeota archaeon]|nr:hypothetical protein [Thermoproteota archaeon]MCR8454802.1 hypothetical protein [Thermoproteota archaeon]